VEDLATIVAGPFLLVFQTGLLLAGLYVIFRITCPNRGAAWWTLRCSPASARP
jgi:hypothetical protein